MSDADRPAPTPSPLFVVSQPRAGSTLLQRMLARHPEIASAPEPWLLLPLLAFREPDLEVSAYSTETTRIAMDEFIAGLPDGERTWREEIARLVRRLYAGHASGGERYFLDKTPRYVYLLERLDEYFPDAKIIYLRRDPLQVLASIIDTFCDGRLSGLFRYHADFMEFPGMLAAGLPSLAEPPIEVSYEMLVRSPDETLADVFESLELSYEDVTGRPLDASLRGRMGDPSGVERYRSVSTASLERWREVLAGRVRRGLARRMLDTMDAQAWSRLGFDKAELHARLDALPMRRSWIAEGRDGLDLIYSTLRRSTKAHLFGTRQRSWFRRRFFT